MPKLKCMLTYLLSVCYYSLVLIFNINICSSADSILFAGFISGVCACVLIRPETIHQLIK